MSSNMSCPNNPDFAVADVPGYQKYDKQAVPSSAATTVPDKFKGTKNDQNDMVLLGKKQVLRRNFKFTSILGFASTGRLCQEVRTAGTLRIDA
jgi:choline transport protein